MRKRMKALLMALLLLVTAVLCGCGGSTEQAEKKEVQSEGSPSYGGSVTVGITQELSSLDPHKSVAAGTREVLYNIFEGLVKVDVNGELVPAVASAYSISEDGMKYSFTLRDGVKFHDGTPVTVNDVIYSLKRCAGLLETSDSEVQVIPAFSVISDIVATDNGLDVVLSEPNTELIGYFTCSIIPEKYENQAEKPIGTGPFKFVSYTKSQSFVMEKNEDYYVEGVPYIDKATFKISANTDAAFMELLGGSIDIFPYLTYEQSSQLSGKFDILSGEINLVQALFLNNAVAPFDNKLVRQAMCYAVNRQEILQILAGGNGHVIGSNMFPGFERYYDETLETYYAYDTEKAKQLLSEAGYPDGFTFTISVPSNYQYHVDTAQVIVEQLKKVGITAKIQQIEWASWISDVYTARKFEATVVGLDAKLAPSDVLRFYPSEAKKNFMNYSNAEFDAKFAEAVAAVDMEKKASLYKELQKMLTEDAASVYTVSQASLVAVNPKLKGYKFFPIYVQDMSSIYFTE